MFNLFKSKTEVAEPKVKGRYPAVVEAIHREFNLAGDRLLKEAKEIIAGLSITNNDKIQSLKSFGFGNVKEVQETNEKIKIKEKNESVAKALEFCSITYPQYKFITPEVAINICEKYNLVLGRSEQYTAFVPQKNVNEIENFFKNENEINTFYYRQYRGAYIHGKSEITKQYYDREMEETNRRYERLSQIEVANRQFIAKHTHDEYYGKEKKRLSICAPLKDMNMKGHELKGRLVVKKEIPDPVVLCPYKVNDIDLYCIVTAWGDEASDELVVNQQMN